MTQPYPQHPPLSPMPDPLPRANAGKVALIALIAVVALAGATAGAWFLFGGTPDTRLTLPATFGGQPKDPDRSEEPTTDVDEDLKKIVPTAVEAMNGTYGKSSTTGGVLLVGGVNGPIENPSATLDTYLREYGKDDDNETRVLNLTEVDAGPLGGKARCGTVPASSSTRPPREVCIWANNTVFGLMAAGPDHAVAKNFVRLRGEVEQKI